MQGWMNVPIICFLIIFCSPQLWFVCPKEATFPDPLTFWLLDESSQLKPLEEGGWREKPRSLCVSVELYFYSNGLLGVCEQAPPLIAQFPLIDCSGSMSCLVVSVLSS